MWWYDHKGALTRIFATSCYDILWGCVIFSFLLVPDLLKVKCGLKFARAFFWCHFVTGLYPVKKQAPHLTQQTALMFEHWWKSLHTYSEQEDFTKNSWRLVDIGTCSIISLCALAQAHSTFLVPSAIANPYIFAHLDAFQCIWSFHMCINSHVYSSRSCI